MASVAPSPSPKEEASQLAHKLEMPAHEEYISMDCEMVGTLTDGSVAARVALVNWYNVVILDEYILPNEQVTDYRTFVSGITADILEKRGKPMEEVRAKVLSLIHKKVLVGHALTNDLKSMRIKHHKRLQRDTAFYIPFMKKLEKEDGSTVMLSRRLRDLATEQLNRSIQVEGKSHSPVEDAIAALDLYKFQRHEWERSVRAKIEEKKNKKKKPLPLPQKALQQLQIEEESINTLQRQGSAPVKENIPVSQQELQQRRQIKKLRQQERARSKKKKKIPMSQEKLQKRNQNIIENKRRSVHQREIENAWLCGLRQQQLQCYHYTPQLQQIPSEPYYCREHTQQQQQIRSQPYY